ncbi:SnoaL-like protein [Saccharothrix saharensis]|uniref:SnoaL-like protein n=1 Tax=Saccharothrix saharensis TaxID=571190 RepID=A0A543JPE7_9PSEU|nr:SnoaL-like protein [Saccharothrix saharensis]
MAVADLLEPADAVSLSAGGGRTRDTRLTPSAPGNPTPMVSIHELYRRWLDELWHGNRDVAADLVTEDFVGHWPDRDVTGPADLAAVVRETHAMFTDLSFALEVGPVVEGDLVAARWTGRGRTAQGPMRFVGHDILRVRDGRFAEYWVATRTDS